MAGGWPVAGLGWPVLGWRPGWWLSGSGGWLLPGWPSENGCVLCCGMRGERARCVVSFVRLRHGQSRALSGLVWPCHAPLTWVDGQIGERIGGSVCGQLPLTCSISFQPPSVSWKWPGTRGRERGVSPFAAPLRFQVLVVYDSDALFASFSFLY